MAILQRDMAMPRAFTTIRRRTENISCKLASESGHAIMHNVINGIHLAAAKNPASRQLGCDLTKLVQGNSVPTRLRLRA